MAWDLMKVENSKPCEKISYELKASKHYNEWLSMSLIPQFEICGSNKGIID